MVDILQLLIQVLNINCSIVTCTYPTIWETLFYVIFFPTVFLLLFVYALSGALAGKLGVPFRLLIAIAVFIYIVLQGFFTFFVSISGLWLFLIILIGFIWFIIRHIFGKGGGSGLPSLGGGRLGGIVKKAVEKKIVLPTLYHFEKKILGKPGEEKYVDNALKQLERAIGEWKRTPEGEAKSRMYNICKDLATGVVFRGIEKFETMAGTARAKPYWDNYERLTTALGIKIRK